MAYLDALNQLCQPIRARDYPHTLRPMYDLMVALGSPQRGLKAVVVAGSTGKGTTCHHLARLLRANGLQVGVYTSPHLHSFRERFVYNDVPISEEEFVTGFEIVRAAAATLPHHYSTFELATALALWWFARKQPDIVVLEVGLGGRYDAVNVVDNVLAILTRVEMEHAAMLGGSLRSIAWHKAGIIRPGGHVVTVKQSPEAFMVIEAEARQRYARLHLDGGRNLTFEGGEAVLAVAAWANLLERGLIPRRPFLPGLRFDNLPGRLEQITLKGRTLLIDGGHTPDAARRLRAEILRLTRPLQPVRVIVGMLGDKSAQSFLQQFDIPRFHVTLTQAPSHRAALPELLYAQAAYRFASLDVVPDLSAAFDQAASASEALVVIAGSMRMAAAAREHFGLLTPAEIAEAEATRAIFDGSGYLARLEQPAVMVQTG